MSSDASSGGDANICYTCKMEITTSQFIRVGAYKFHKKHFTCSVCNASLHGQKFHHKDQKFFCSADYVKVFCHTCRHCNEKISSGSVIQAFGGYYHPEHFVCATCEAPFKNGKYYESNSQPFCEEHYFKLTLEKCDACGKTVSDSDMVRVQGKIFHNSCLSCHHCKAPLAKQGSIFQKDTHVYCREDYLNFFCKRCTSCADHILKHCISVNDEYYHPDCLKCSVCSKKLDKYICISGHLRCSAHSNKDCVKLDCSVCSKKINGEVMLAVGMKCHQDCFKCHFCKKGLQKSQAKLRSERLCCSECMVKPDSQLPAGSLPKSATKAAAKSASKPAAAASTSSTASSSSKLAAPAASKSASSKSKHKSNRSQQITMAPTIGLDEKISWKKGDLIGKGSFGKVYMGMNTVTGELIAVKQVRMQSDEDTAAAEAIELEIQMMRGLQHPNIVQLLGTEKVGQKLNILMEYVPGKSLDTLLENFGSFSEKVVKSYSLQLLEALAYCHEHNVVHRDIKGKNILVDTQGNLKLADFGSAKRFENVMGKDAPSLSYNYTPLWTAPEVLVGNYNAKVDVWSMGCVLIEMLTAKPPWSEQNFENPFRALYHIGNSNSIPQIPECTPVGKSFLLAALTRDPDQRPTARELLQHEWLMTAGKDEDAAGHSDDSDSESD